MFRNIIKKVYYPMYTLFIFPKDYRKMDKLSNSHMPKKNFVLQLFDAICWSFMHGEYFDYYFLSGANLKHKSLNEFIGGAQFRKLRDDNNFKNSNIKMGYNDIILLRNKQVFEKWMSYHDIPVVSSLYTDFGRELKKVDFDFEKKYFFKAVDGQQGKDIYYVTNEDDLLMIKDDVVYIVQEELIQHPFVDNIYENSINTIRIITVRNQDKVEVLCALHRFGTEESKKVDNWSAGGIIVPIDLSTGLYKKQGILSKKAVLNGDLNIYHESHPNSCAVWGNKKVPMWSQVKEVACAAHETLPEVWSVGWDIVVTPEKVIVLEGNDNWGISTVQSSLQGAKQLILEKTKEV